MPERMFAKRMRAGLTDDGDELAYANQAPTIGM